MKFYKYEATGNDFILFKNEVKRPNDLALSICDRHFGIGADGILFPSKSHVADIKMNYYNSDGTLATMCGNGIRAFTRFLLDEKIISKNNFNIETLAGIINVEVLNGLIKVNLNKPLTNLKEPFLSKKVDHLELVNINEFKGYLINTGVLHTVLFKEDNKTFNLLVNSINIQQNDLFLNQTNVNYVEVLNDDTIKVDTYERGSGFTLSCGTGVGASAYVAYKLNKVKSNIVNVLVIGGNLKVEIINDLIYLIGPANKIGSGIYERKY